MPLVMVGSAPQGFGGVQDHGAHGLPRGAGPRQVRAGHECRPAGGEDESARRQDHPRARPGA